MVEGAPRVTIAREDSIMVCEPRFRPRTTARRGQTYMRRDRYQSSHDQADVIFYLFFRM